MGIFASRVQWIVGTPERLTGQASALNFSNRDERVNPAGYSQLERIGAIKTVSDDAHELEILYARLIEEKATSGKGGSS